MLKYISEEKVVERALPNDWGGRVILLRCAGGIGDLVIAIGSVAKFLRKKECKVIAEVRPQYMNLAKELIGVDEVRSSKGIVDTQNIDVFLELTYFCVNSRQLLNDDYYKLAFKSIGVNNENIQLGEFSFKHNPIENVIGIHPSASNPIRRWENDRWEQLARNLIDSGYKIKWFGDKLDFCYRSDECEVIADTKLDILEQAKELATCSNFIGCDSGFCHIAGVLGIPGVVLFTASDPIDVIGQYKSLKPVAKFIELGIKPSRSLKNNDPKSRVLSNGIFPIDVLTKLNIPMVKKKITFLPQFNKLDLLKPVGKLREKVSEWFNFSDDGFEPNINTYIYDSETLRKLVRMQIGEQFPKHIKEMPIRVIINGGIGDVVMGTAFLNRLKELFPVKQIDCRVKKDYEPLVSKFINKFSGPAVEIVLDYYGCWNTNQHAVNFMGGSLSEIEITKPKKFKLSAPTIAFFPRQGKLNPFVIKEWSDENWIELINQFPQYKWYQCGGRGDELIKNSSVIDARQLDVLNIAGMINSVDLVVTIEGAAQHLAKALKKKAIVLWGKSADPSWIGYKEHINIISKSANSCNASVDLSSFKECDCCGGGCINHIDIEEVSSKLRDCMGT